MYGDYRVKGQNWGGQVEIERCSTDSRRYWTLPEKQQCTECQSMLSDKGVYEVKFMKKSKFMKERGLEETQGNTQKQLS